MKKILCGLLCAVMLLICMPAAALAADGPPPSGVEDTHPIPKHVINPETGETEDWGEVEVMYHYLGGKLYANLKVWYYIPNEIREDTGLVLMLPGGEEDELLSLPTDLVVYYFIRHEPNAVMVFLATSGYPETEKTRDQILTAVEFAAEEANIQPHDMVVAGYSLGAYTALKIAASAEEKRGITVKSVLAFDAAYNWDIPEQDWLTEHDVDVLLEKEIPLYLFEQIDADITKMPLATELLEEGCQVELVGCVNGDHFLILEDIFECDVFTWALGGKTTVWDID